MEPNSLRHENSAVTGRSTLPDFFMTQNAGKGRKTPMPLNVKEPEAERLARELAERTGETITEAVIKALRERLTREECRESVPDLKEEILAIGRRCAALPDRDTRSADEILGYDERGLPG